MQNNPQLRWLFGLVYVDNGYLVRIFSDDSSFLLKKILAGDIKSLNLLVVLILGPGIM